MKSNTTAEDVLRRIAWFLGRESERESVFLFPNTPIQYHVNSESLADDLCKEFEIDKEEFGKWVDKGADEKEAQRDALN